MGLLLGVWSLSVQQITLPLPSDLTHAIAEALAWWRGRDYPNDADWHDAEEKADKWNRQRVEFGLEPYR